MSEVTKVTKVINADAALGQNLRKLTYSPNTNPLLEAMEIEIKRRKVRASAKSTPMANTETGEVIGDTVIYTYEDRDDESFVKVFSQGVSAAFELTKTATRVFSIVLKIYEATPMRGGYADSVYLAWFSGGLSGQSIDMSDRTFHKGFKELLAKGFLSPKAPNLFWVNPALFFKGDRVAFVKEYRRRPAIGTAKHNDEQPPKAERAVEQGDWVGKED